MRRLRFDHAPPFGSSGSLHLNSFIILFDTLQSSELYTIESIVVLLRSRWPPIAVDRSSIQRIFESQSSDRNALDRSSLEKSWPTVFIGEINRVWRVECERSKQEDEGEYDEEWHSKKQIHTHLN